MSDLIDPKEYLLFIGNKNGKPEMAKKLAVITAKHFCAGIEISGTIVVDAAPIVRYMIGWDVWKVDSYVKKKGWKIETYDEPI